MDYFMGECYGQPRLWGVSIIPSGKGFKALKITEDDFLVRFSELGGSPPLYAPTNMEGTQCCIKIITNFHIVAPS